MRTLVVGGGPGGLYLATLLRRAGGHEVTVLERNRPEDTFGFGVVFSDQTLGSLRGPDQPTAQAMEAAMARWDTIELRLPGRVVRSAGHGFSSIARKRLLQILQRRARALGADLRFGQEAPDVAGLAGEYDLVVGADGINSAVRAGYAAAFGPSEQVGAARFIWFGTSCRYDSMTFLFEQDEHGAFGVHAYPFDDQASTFLVETDEESWRRAGLDRSAALAGGPGQSDLHALAYLERLFAGHLDGHPLLANNSRWQRFRTIRTRRWWHRNVVLVGDAAHTAHFSVGSGTKMAMEDAVALAAALGRHAELDDALAAYEAERRPEVERIQRAAEPSLAWWERFGRNLDKDPRQFAFHFFTRTPRVTHENLRVRDGRLVRAVERWWAERHRPGPGARAALPPLATALTLRGVELPNRVSVQAGDPAAPGAAVTEADLVYVGGYALCGAGLVATDRFRVGGSGDQAAAWRRVTGFVHARSAAKLAARLQVAPAGRELERCVDACLGGARAAGAAGFDLLELVLAGVLEPVAAAWLTRVLEAVRPAWPADLPIGVELPIAGPDGQVAADACLALAGRLVAGGCDLVALRAHGGWRQLAVSERVRDEAGVPTMLVGVATTDAASTAVLSGRADLVRGWPRLASPDWRPPPLER